MSAPRAQGKRSMKAVALTDGPAKRARMQRSSLRSNEHITHALLNGDGCLKTALVLTMLAGVLYGAGVHAQSQTVLFGFGNPSLRYILAPDSYSWWRDNRWPRCRRFGLGTLDDLGPHFRPHFLWAADPVWLVEPFIARARGEALNGGESMIFSMPPLPWC